MNTVFHENGRILNADSKFTLRNEYNGMTVYSREEHLFRFYEGLFIEDVIGEGSCIGAKAVRKLMAENRHLLTRNVQSDNLFSACWLISGTCNLDCIYCFAENKMPERRKKGSDDSGSGAAFCDEMETAKHLLSLKPMCITLTGGEPTLNPKLGDILHYFKGKVSTILDTNGTTPQLIPLLPALKDAGTTLRVTVDILDEEILRQVRPEYNSAGLSHQSQTEMLKKNMKALGDAGIPFVVHTVLTKYNIGKLEDTAETLIRLGVKRWHFYPVDYSEKCKNFFGEIKVSRQEACDYTDTLAEKYEKDLMITCPRNDLGFRECTVLMVDCRGNFLVDTIRHGTVSIGKDSCHPQKDEIMEKLNYERHKQAYLCNFW